jgi:hypothetical protein
MPDLDPAQIWKTALGELQLQVTSDVFEIYLQTTRVLGLDDEVIVVAVPNPFVKEWLDLRLNRLVVKTLQHILNAKIAVKYVVVASSGQQTLGIDPAEQPEAIIRPGELRDPGYVRLWHDLRNFYGPLVGYVGIGVWAELRAHVNDVNGHPLQGKAWPGLRSLVNHYRDGRIAVEGALASLHAADLLDWQTGRDLIELYERQRAAGVSDAQNPGVSPRRLKGILKNPLASRIYTVHDPLELPAFCVRFGFAVELDDSGPRFVEFAGLINGRWRHWLSRLMAANELAVITPNDFRRLGLA